MAWVAPVFKLDGQIGRPAKLVRGVLRPLAEAASLDLALPAKLLGQRFFWHLSEDVDLEPARHALIRDVSLLRVFGFDTVHASFLIDPIRDTVVHYRHLTTWAPRLAVSSDLTTEKLSRIEEFMTQMAGLDFDSPALRWYGLAAERPYMMDRLSHYVIALEGLLVHDRQTEATFTLSTRAAQLLATNPASATEVFEEVRKAYKMRSSLFHGGEPKLKGKSFWEKDGDYEGPAARLRSVARRALLAVHWSNRRGKRDFEAFWKELVCHGPLYKLSTHESKAVLDTAWAVVDRLPEDDALFPSPA